MTTDQRLYTKVVREIEAMIDSGQFPPGSRLPGERDLAKQLGVSRVTIREAQIALQAMNRIEVRTGSGATVLPPSAGRDRLPDVGAFELTQARTLFEGEAAALAASTITEEQLDTLEDLLDRMDDESHADEALHEDVDRSFHLTIARATDNPVITDAIERLWQLRTEVPAIKQAYDSICGLSPDARLREHRDIVDGLRARDPEGARAAMRRHFGCIIEAMLSAAEQQAIEAARRRTLETRERFLPPQDVAAE